jgi:hypothetical protein
MFFLLFLQVHGINSVKKLHAGHNKKSKARYTHGADEHQCKKAHDMNVQKISCAGRHNHEGKPPGMDKINSCLGSNNSLKMGVFLFWHFQMNFISGNSLL